MLISSEYTVKCASSTAGDHPRSMGAEKGGTASAKSKAVVHADDGVLCLSFDPHTVSCPGSSDLTTNDLAGRGPLRALALEPRDDDLHISRVRMNYR